MYKKTKNKFVKKRVYRWIFKVYDSEQEKLEMRADKSSCLNYYERDNKYQLLKSLKEAGFVKGFWLARRLRKKHGFYWDEKLRALAGK